MPTPYVSIASTSMALYTLPAYAILATEYLVFGSIDALPT